MSLRWTFPVMEGERLTGMVSIGDLVNWIMSEQTETIRHLEAYITGTPTIGTSA